MTASAERISRATAYAAWTTACRRWAAASTSTAFPRRARRSRQRSRSPLPPDPRENPNAGAGRAPSSRAARGGTLVPMPIATTEQYAAMLDDAAAGSHALAAVNVTSSESLNGAMRGFAEAGADGIVQVTTGGAEFASGGTVRRHGARSPRARRVRARARAALPGRDRAAHRPCDPRALRRVRPAADRRVAPPRRGRCAAAVQLAHVRWFDAAARGQP